MSTHVDKTPDNHQQQTANNVLQQEKKTDTNSDKIASSSSSEFHTQSQSGAPVLPDNRPVAIQMKALQAMANKSAQSLKMEELQAMADKSAHSRQFAYLQSLTDQRPQAAIQRKLAALAANDSRPEAKKMAELKALSDQKAMAEREALFGKPATEEDRSTNNTGLPDPLKSGVEGLSGYSMDDVKVHRNSDKPGQLQAHAYAQGTDIHLGPGQEQHLPHEAWHVVQQKQGRVQPTVQMKGQVQVNDDAGLEKEADVMGDKAAAFGTQTPVQKQAALDTGAGGAVVQRFEAPLHESATRNALTEDGEFSQDEASMVYYGNWMRDVNQGLVPSLIESMGADTVYALLGYISWQKFGKIPTGEQLGYYILSEHLDSPVGAIEGSAFAAEAPKISSDSQNQDMINPEGAEKRENHITKQQSTAPNAAAVDGKSLGIFDVDSSAVMGYVRRTNVHVENRLTLAAERGRNEDGFLHLGAAMHAVEDLFAHSNFVEIAVENLLNNELSGLFSDLRDTKTGKLEIQAFAPEVTVGVNSKGEPLKRKALATGSFSTLDTMESIGHEMTHMLRQPPKPPQSLEEVKAMNTLMAQMGSQADAILDNDANKKQLEKLLEDNFDNNIGGFILAIVQFGGIENFIRFNNGLMEILYSMNQGAVQMLSYQISLLVYNGAMLPMADQMESLVLETNVGETAMVNVLESNKDTIASGGGYGNAAEAAIDQALGFDSSGKTEAEIAAHKAGRVAAATQSKNLLEATPEMAVAGPSHSQISKDHKNSVFFGLGFQLAVEADKMIKAKILDVWKGQKQAEVPYGKEGEEGETNMHDVRAEDIDRNTATGKHVVNEGYAKETFKTKTINGKTYPEHAEEYRPDLAGMKKDAADSLRDVAVMLEAFDQSPEQLGEVLKSTRGLLHDADLENKGIALTDKLDQVLDAADSGLIAANQEINTFDLSATAEEINTLANEMQNAKTLDEREAIYIKLRAIQNSLLTYITSQQNASDFTRKKAGYATVLTAMNRAVAFNAPSIGTYQRDVLAGDAHVSGIPERLQGNLKVDKEFKMAEVSNHVAGLGPLLNESRKIIDHPQNNDWWKPIVKKYATESKTQQFLKDSIMARNSGFSTFREHEH